MLMLWFLVAFLLYISVNFNVVGNSVWTNDICCFCRNKFKKPSFNLSEFQELEAEGYKGWQIIQGHNRYVFVVIIIVTFIASSFCMDHMELVENT